MAKVSLNIIATAAGCSTVTVYKAINNQDGVGKELRRKILEIAANLGYQTTVQKCDHDFLFIINQDFMVSPGEQFYTTIFYYLNQIADKQGCNIHLIFHDDPSQTIEKIQLFIKKNTIGGIFISGKLPFELLKEIANLHIHTVGIDFYSSDFNFDYVYVDNYYSGYTVAKYLVNLGHRNIAFVGDITLTSQIADRYFGYLRAVNKFSLPSSYHCNNSYPTNLDELLSQPCRPTAIICHCDKSANNILQLLTKYNISVPNNMSVIGFDNTDLCTAVTPQLTSYGIEKSVYASAAFELMTSNQNKIKSSSTYSKLDLTLSERDSVCKISN